MRVAELFQPRRIRLAEREIADPGPGEVQVRVNFVGICGSDLHYFSEGAIGDTPCTYPMVLGHEPTGVVAKTGVGVTGWSAGDPAVLEPALPCYQCEFCLAGRHNVCSRLRFLSSPDDPGFFRDFVNLPARNLLPLPPELRIQDGTLVEPLAVVLHSMSFAALRLGETAAVFGAGPIGLMTIAALKLSGAGRVWAVEPVTHRREMARPMGACAVIDPGAVDPVRQILSETGGRGVDVSFDCAGRGDSINQCLRVTRNAGRVVYTGIPSGVHVPVDHNVMRRKELALYNVRRSNHESEAALELLRERQALFAPLLTHEFPLEETETAFLKLERYEDGVVKVLIRL